MILPASPGNLTMKASDFLLPSGRILNMTSSSTTRQSEPLISNIGATTPSSTGENLTLANSFNLSMLVLVGSHSSLNTLSPPSPGNLTHIAMFGGRGVGCHWEANLGLSPPWPLAVMNRLGDTLASKPPTRKNKGITKES